MIVFYNGASVLKYTHFIVGTKVFYIGRDSTFFVFLFVMQIETSIFAQI